MEAPGTPPTHTHANLDPLTTAFPASNNLLWGLPQVAQWKRIHPPMEETPVQSLGREDPLEEERAAHSSIFAWKIPWTEERGRLQSLGSQRVGHN